ncbi:hypothetical protein, partial [Faecalispora jeddahensis]|uniref:hypothetical protein n=1 Tax=Faecalispora jeddahensis TaxID=1414721 RepID=UPI001A9BD569
CLTIVPVNVSTGSLLLKLLLLLLFEPVALLLTIRLVKKGRACPGPRDKPSSQSFLCGKPQKKPISPQSHKIIKNLNVNSPESIDL